MAIPKVGGIYEIVNLVNGKRYVGSAVDVAQRWRQHQCELRKGRHNPHLQNAWNKHGAEAFEFRVIELVADKADLIGREQHYLDTIKPEYNCAKVAGSNLGITWSAETKARMGAASKKVWSDPDYRARMSIVHTGRTLPQEQRDKIGAAHRGRKLSPEHAAKVAENNRRRNQSDEHRARVSAFWSGREKTPEQIAKMAETKRGRPAHNKGVPMSAEQKAKLSAAMKRKYEDDPELRAKISAATKAAMNAPEVRAKVARANLGRKQGG